ncbi:MAG: tRNA (adenosine(37)-N6)-threonylcarbamoyltransferase complex dimerization subunit type 1 TsaB [Ruminococcus sp.]|nr:tRNA (adenosine(37)-N6)-threonylcarbamoyltransferase complex dimerization subunit type 1 TsaB [Ruminococcus sp.]
MKKLFLDTSSSHVVIAILEDDDILYLYNEEILDDMSSKIMTIISEGFKTLDFSIKDIDSIYVANGPGSFTGIRIGVTIAKTIAWALKKDIISISTLELYASTDVDTKYIVPMIDARRGYVYTGIYDNNLDMIVQDQYVKYDEFMKKLDSDYTVVSYDEQLANDIPLPNIIKLLNKHKNDNSMVAHNVNPNYLKRTEAEEQLERINDKKNS